MQMRTGGGARLKYSISSERLSGSVTAQDLYDNKVNSHRISMRSRGSSVPVGTYEIALQKGPLEDPELIARGGTAKCYIRESSADGTIVLSGPDYDQLRALLMRVPLTGKLGLMDVVA
jgi:hypothetical protein